MNALRGTVGVNPKGYTLASKNIYDEPRFVPIPSHPTIAATNPNDVFWDSQFGPSGNENITVNAIVVSNGRIFIGGYFQYFLGMECNSLAYWDGGRWRSVSNGGLRSSSNGLGSVSTLAAAPNGDIYIGGIFGKAGTIICNNVTRWNGSSFTQIGNGVSSTGSVNAIAVDGQDVYLGGSFTVDGVDGSNNIVKWNGASWETLKTGITSGSVSAMVVKGDVLYVGGNFKTVDDKQANNIIIWNKTSSSWETMGQGLTSIGNATTNIQAMVISPQGELVVGGDFLRTGTKVLNNLARWTGSDWESIGGGVLGGGVTALLYDGNDLYVAGGFEKAATNNDVVVLARWDGSQWHDAGGQILLASAAALAKLGDKLLVGGSFDLAITDQFIIHGIGLWDGSSWTSVGGSRGNGTDATVNDMAVDKNGNLIVSGAFSRPGGVKSLRIASFMGDHWEAIDSIPFGSSGSVNIATQGDDILISGSFDSTGFLRGNGVVRYSPQTKALKVLGTARGRFGVRVSTVVADGNTIYAGGNFTLMEQDTVRGICRYDGTKWYPLGKGVQGASGSVDVIVPSGNNVYVGGSFTTAGETAAASIALWNGSTWEALGSGVSNTGQAASVSCIAIIGNDVYVGGRFEKAGDIPVRNLARWNTQTKQWSAVGKGLNRPASTMYLKDHFLFIGGDFDSAGSIAAGHIVRYDTQNDAWFPLGSGVDGSVVTMAFAHNALYLGGSFESAGNKGSINIARWMQELTPVEEQPIVSTASSLSGTVFPNPASAETVIGFTTTAAGMITLGIYTNTGEQVAQLMQEYGEAASYSRSWNPAGLPNGIYYARLQCGRTTLVKKIVVAR